MPEHFMRVKYTANIQQKVKYKANSIYNYHFISSGAFYITRAVTQ
jgi:hypothetical protein